MYSIDYTHQLPQGAMGMSHPAELADDVGAARL